MTFKPTHRSTVAGTPLMQVSHDDPLGYGVYENGEGHRMLLNDDQVESIPLEEPVKLEPGKCYRWTVAGTAVDRYDEEFPEHRIDLVYGGVAFLTSDEVSWGTLELLPDPLPITPGSVVEKGDLFCLHPPREGDPYNWKRVTGSPDLDSSDWVSSVYLVGATVRFDAGKDAS